MGSGRLISRIALALLLTALGGASLAGKITVDPNVGRTSATKDAGLDVTDPRLAQKVTYQVQYRAVHLIVSDLAAMTGVKLITGASKTDWPVRDRKMNIFVKDVRLADLVNSIAHTMKFHWTRSEKLDPPVYRLIVDRKAAIAADALKADGQKANEDLWQSRRDDWIDTIEKYGSRSPSDLGALRETDPIACEYIRRGAVQAIHALFNEVPETKSRYAAGRSFRISSQKLSLRTKSLCFYAGNELWKYLQMIGYVSEPTKEPPGYAGLVEPDDTFDIACHRLNVEGFTPNLRWGGGSIGDTGYFHIMKNGRDFEIANLPSRDSDWDRFRSKAHNRMWDDVDDEQAWSSADNPRDKLQSDLKAQEELFFPSEPLVEHDAFPGLEQKAKLKVESPDSKSDPVMAINGYIASFQKALAEATGMGVVSDSWVDISGDKLPDEEATLGEWLDRFSTQFNYNWSKSSGILEFRHRKWWKNRLNQVPDEWVAAWSENTRKSGILSLDDLAGISMLNYYQAEESVRPDKVMGEAGLYKTILNILDRNGNLHWLRLYASLSPSLRALLLDTRGVNGFMLTQDQWKLAQTMFDRIGASRGDALFRLEVVPNPDTIVYRFSEADTDTDEQDRVWEVGLPRYTPPPDTLETKQ